MSVFRVWGWFDLEWSVYVVCWYIMLIPVISFCVQLRSCLVCVLSLVDFVIYVFCEQQGIEPIADVLIIRFTVVWKVLYGLICNSGRDPSFVDVVVVNGCTIPCDRVITTTSRFWSHRECCQTSRSQK
jgi:hypothetical protein